VYVAVLLIPPPLAVMVTVYVPAGVELDAVMVIVDENVGVPDDGLKLADAPDGRPEAERLTAGIPADPDTAETVTVVEALPPGATVPLSGLTETEKSKMFSVKVFERVSPPPVPVTVIV